ncbi:predicted protein, partial [Ostreococcus lucimarinus CCE9901]
LDWIRVTFRECVSDDVQLAGFYLALVTIACWMSAQVPQLVLNYRAKSARGLSPYFLLQWLAGDSFNLIGCVLTGDQAPTQTYTAVYFVLSDLALLCQYTYYERDGARARASASDDEGSVSGPMSPVGGFVLAGAAALALTTMTTNSAGEASNGMLREAMNVTDCDYNANPAWMQSFGRGVGYLATCFYLGGRLAQIAKNRRRRSVEGLSLTMFALAITANVAYGTSVLCASHSRADVIRSLPWLLGSFGTVSLDATILAQ